MEIIAKKFIYWRETNLNSNVMGKSKNLKMKKYLSLKIKNYIKKSNLKSI